MVVAVVVVVVVFVVVAAAVVVADGDLVMVVVGAVGVVGHYCWWRYGRLALSDHPLLFDDPLEDLAHKPCLQGPVKEDGLVSRRQHVALS